MKSCWLPKRQYPRGVIRQAILVAMPVGVEMRSDEIVARTQGIHPRAILRNVSAMVTAGEVRNLGRWHAARYVRVG